MAVHDTNDGQAAAPKQSAAQQSAPTPNFAPAARPQAQRNTNMSTNSIKSLMAFKDPITNVPHAEAISNFQETIKRALPPTIDDFVMTIISVDGQTNQLNISSIIVAIQFGQKGQATPGSGVAYHALLLADTLVQKDRQDVVQINGQNVSVIRPPSDAYDEKFKAQIAAIVAREFRGVSPDKIYDADGEVIPAGFEYKSDDQVRAVMYNALKAAASTLVTCTPDTGAEDFSLARAGGRLTVNTRVSIHQPHAVDPVGQPVRSDIVIDFIEVKNTEVNREVLPSIHSGEQSEKLFTMNGFMDLMWNPEDSNVGNGGQFAFAPLNQQPRTKLYQPRFVITRSDVENAGTLPVQLLQLASVLALTQNNAWMAQFMPQKGIKNPMHNIGNIGYEAIPALQNQPGAPFNTLDDQFSMQQLGALLQTYFHSDLWISMDIEECGPGTWANSIFMAGAQGNSRANQEIFAAADYLTGGIFKTIYNGNGQAVISDQNRIHLGYYLDSKGQRRDLRDVDVLAVMGSEGKNNPENIRGWTDSYQRADYPLEQRLDFRMKIIRRILGDGVVVTGYARRVTFENAFLNALLQAIVKTNVNLRAITPLQDGNVAARALPSFLQQATALNANGGFRSAFGQTNQNGFMNNGGFNRWG